MLDKTPVLIIGGGVAGLAAALELARRGAPSLIVERGPVLGGRAAVLCCKAVSACARCGACRVGDLLGEALARPEITAVTLAQPSAAQPEGGAWRVTLEPVAGEAMAASSGLGAPLGAPVTVEAGAVILALGHTPFDPKEKTRFGHGRVAGVVTALELEEALAQGGTPGGAVPGRVAFIQCVGSRDQSLGHLFCSRICCGFALRLAKLLKGQARQSQITFFHMDVQGYGRAWEAELPAMRQDIRFIRAMPGEVRSGKSGPEVLFAQPDGNPAREEFDLVVLSIGLMPPLAREVAAMFGVGDTPDGFLDPGQAPAGVFVAGTAQGPRSIVETIEHASGMAALAWAGLGPASEAAHG
jgi:heterodisulfide reductase subunit A